MHSIEELGTNVPAFLAKLWKIVEDPETNDLICWNSHGTSFTIRNQARFARELLPLYYKHNNMASFIRQLNMYGFHKIVSIEGGGLKVDKDEMEFAHPCFVMGHPYLLENIKRKIPNSKVEIDTHSSKPEIITKVLSEVKNMKGRQDTVDSQLLKIQRENEVLWREVAILRQKHHKQQQIVNKLIQFLVTMVQSPHSSGLGLKRHYPLMINDSSHRSKKMPKFHIDLSKITGNLSPKGPVIHELDPSELLEDCVPNIDDMTEDSARILPEDLYDAVTFGEVQSPTSSSSSSLGAVPVISNDIVENSQPSPKVLLELVEDCSVSPGITTSASSPIQLTADPAAILSPEVMIDPSILETDVEPPCVVEQGVVIDPTVVTNIENLNPLDSSSKTKNKTIVKKGGESDGKKKKRRRSSSGKESDPNYEPPRGKSSLKGKVPSKKVCKLLDKNTTSADTKQRNSINDTKIKSPIDVATDEAISAITNVASAASENNLESSPSYILPIDPSELSPSLDDEVLLSSVPDVTVALNDKEIASRDMIHNHVGTVESELDNLKELLKGDLDDNTLLGIFNDERVQYNFSPTMNNTNGQQNTQGNELETYSNNLFDLEDMLVDSDIGKWSVPVSPDIGNTSEYILSDLNTPQILLQSPGISSDSSNK